MPKEPIPPGYAKVEVEGIYGPATWANVLYFDMNGGVLDEPNSQAQAAWNAAHALYENFASSQFSDQWQVTKQRITYRADEDSTYSFTIADAILGTHSGDSQDAQVAYLINWVSGDARKGGKPRQYIPGVPNAAMLDSARIQSSYVTAINGYIAAWLAAFPYTDEGGGSAGALVEMSFVNGKAFRNPPVATDIVAGHLNIVVATQRRRVDRLR